MPIPNEYIGLKGYLSIYTDNDLRLAIAIAEILKKENIGTNNSVLGTVSVDNFPVNQEVTVTNFPNDQSVFINNFPANQEVIVTDFLRDQNVNVINFPFIQQIQGLVTVGNFPELQEVSDQNIGARTDISATSDTGSFSLISLMKRVLTKLVSVITPSSTNSISSAIPVAGANYGFDGTNWYALRVLNNLPTVQSSAARPHSNVLVTATGSTEMVLWLNATAGLDSISLTFDLGRAYKDFHFHYKLVSGTPTTLTIDIETSFNGTDWISVGSFPVNAVANQLLQVNNKPMTRIRGRISVFTGSLTTFSLWCCATP